MVKCLKSKLNKLKYIFFITKRDDQVKRGVPLYITYF